MAKICIKAKEVDHDERKANKVRKRNLRARKKKDATLLKNLEMRLRQRTMKQTRRWIMHVRELPTRGGLSVDIEQELVAHTRKPYQEREKTRLSLEPELSPQAGEFWRTFQTQRKAAMAVQGQSFEAMDWWVRKGGGGKWDGARVERFGKEIHSLSTRLHELGVEHDESQIINLGVDDEGEPELEGLEPLEPTNTDYDEQDDHEGGVQLTGSYSPAMLSPVVSLALEEELPRMEHLRI